MGTPDPRLEKTLARALQIADQTQRAAFVARACGGDAGLRREVEARLGISQDARKLALSGLLLLSVGLNVVLANLPLAAVSRVVLWLWTFCGFKEDYRFKGTSTL